MEFEVGDLVREIGFGLAIVVCVEPDHMMVSWLTNEAFGYIPLTKTCEKEEHFFLISRHNSDMMSL
jgi:hypothetical protein